MVTVVLCYSCVEVVWRVGLPLKWRHIYHFSSLPCPVVTASCCKTILSNIKYVEFHLVATSCINFSCGRDSCSCTHLNLSDAFMLWWTMFLHLIWRNLSVVSGLIASWTTKLSVCVCSNGDFSTQPLLLQPAYLRHYVWHSTYCLLFVSPQSLTTRFNSWAMWIAVFSVEISVE